MMLGYFYSWGKTIPEYSIWYRRRDNHSEMWANWSESGVEKFRQKCKEKYLQIFNGSFPKIVEHQHSPNSSVPETIPVENILQKNKRRLLILLPWFKMGGADKYNLDLVEGLIEKDWEITLVATLKTEQTWLHEFTGFTPDVFILPHFLHI